MVVASNVLRRHRDQERARDAVCDLWSRIAVALSRCLPGPGKQAANEAANRSRRHPRYGALAVLDGQFHDLLVLLHPGRKLDRSDEPGPPGSQASRGEIG